MKTFLGLEIHVTWLEGLGASYRIKGYFTVGLNSKRKKIEFNAIAFGGNYGGHNVNVQIEDSEKAELMSANGWSENDVESLISEVQRKMLNNEMIVEYEKLKQDTEGQDPFKNMNPTT